MKKLLIASIVLVGVTAAASAAVVPRFLFAGDISVTVTYTGKAKVDETHEILVFLFDQPTPTAESMPIAMQATTKSGGTVTFKDVATSPVYVTAVFDEAANYDGQSGPPPAGAPIGSYQKGGKAIPVTPGPDAKIKMSFDDSVRWK
jgi:hypothetical protein